MENDFLHKINIDALSKETNLTADEIAELAGISDPKNLGKWGQGKPNGSRPNYKAFVKLFQKGATVETLFGVDYGKSLEGFAPPPEIANDPRFQKGIKFIVEEILKEKGVLK